MTESKLRDRIGIFIILANLLVVGAALTLYFLGGFFYDEITTTVALLVPMFSVYTTAIVKSIIANRMRAEDDSPHVSGSYVFISWLFPIFFTIYLMTMVILKAMNIGFTSFEEFKGMLIASETVFGVYVGLVLASMFNIPRERVTQVKTKSK